MSVSPQLENRKFVIGGIAVGIIIVYLVRLFTLQLLSNDYKKNADSNAFRKEILYPSRGLIFDRNGTLLVVEIVADIGRIGIGGIFCCGIGVDTHLAQFLQTFASANLLFTKF